MRTIESIKEELSNIGFTPGMFVMKEVNELPSILRVNEKIFAVAQGVYDGNTWLVVCTSSRFLFLDKGMLFGLKQVEVPMDKVSSIQFETGLILGSVTISHHGSSKIQNIAKDQVKRFAEQANIAIEQYKTKSSSSVSASPVNDKFEKLEKLSLLKDKGILTEQEFSDEKKKLLAA